MIEQKSQNIHYVPQWLLRKFRQPFLYELDIFTGKTAQRNPQNAASEMDLWPEDIEDGLSDHDSEAARIYRNKISGQTRIALTADEQVNFSCWLAQFYIRAPKRRENAKKFLDEERRNPTSLVAAAVHHNRNKYLSEFRARNPVFYTEAVAEVGQACADEQILAGLVENFSKNKDLPWPDADSVHHSYMRVNQSERFAEILRRYRWTWVRTVDGFVIGDHPLIVWHPKTKQWDYGVERAGAEITMPLSIHLSLLLTQQPLRGTGAVVDCNATTARQFNCRQRVAATKHVLGNSPELLDFVTCPIIL